MIQLDPQLAFDEATHRYYVDGVPAPNVTQVLEYTGLVNYGFLGERRDEYLERGQIVHLATRHDDEGVLAESSVPLELRGYLQAWRAFQRDYGFVPHLIEHRVWHPLHRYAGTLDRVGRCRDNTEWIVDLKTGFAPEAVRYQLVAYSACLPHPRKRLRRSIELHGDGSYKVLAYETSDYARDFGVFLRALETFKAGEKV